MLTATVIFALLSAIFYFQPVQLQTSAQNLTASSNIQQREAPLVSSSIVVSQVYGGGGNSGATYTNDFIELFNRGNTATSLNGWSVQYASATGTTWQVTNLTNVTLQPGQYYLVQEAAGTSGTAALPTPNATGTIAMSGTSGKVLVANVTTAASGADGSSLGASRIDIVSYGASTAVEGSPTNALTASTSARRLQNGCQDADMNSTDFEIITAFQAGNPRNTSSTLNPCGGGGGTTISITNVSVTEGNSGTTTATFTVSLSSPAGAGGVTFDIATQNNTATTADNDYVAQSLTGQTIAAGNSTYTFSVTVNGDTTVEPNETFFVNVTNVTGATPTTVQGTGTIINDETTPISVIQGSGSTSPFAGQVVTTSGIVTGLRSNGFFLQTPDANIDANSETSEGIFVFTSSAPPAAATIGNSVIVGGTVTEFIPSQDPFSPPVTEITLPTVTLTSTGNPLPAPIVLTAAETTNPSETANPLDTLEEYEEMRVSIASLTVVAPTGGFVNEPNATATSNGLFYGVVTGVPRPFREPGIALPDPVPAPMPANVPRFDTNPERLRVDSDAQPGATALNVTTGATVTNLVGVLDYGFRTYTILPDAATPPTVSGNVSATPVPNPLPTDLTVSGFNLERFFDTVNDPGGEPVLTATAFNNRLNKASLAVRNVLKTPDVLGVIEFENLSTLQSLATKINNDAVAAAQPDPNYQAYLEEGNDVGGIDVGFLVKSARVTVVDVTQFGKTTTYTNPNNNTQELLNDRPPLRLRASVLDANNTPFPFTVIVNHLRSLRGVDDPVDGNRIRTKRRAQAEYLANLVQGFQTTDATEKIILVGDFNAFQFNDGLVDLIGTIKGTPTPADQVVLPSSDLVNPDLINLVESLPATQRYSFSFDGNAQVLDHILITQNLQSRLRDFQYARLDVDFPEIFRNDPNRPERISDHDGAIAYISLAGTGGGGQGFEADVFTRPEGNGSVTSSDVSQVQGFQLGLDMPYQSNEFQRADCAPFDTRGDGRVSSIDVSQAQAYQLGFNLTA
ncbi:MAG: lamin tail domain-containing protein, partial [Pyrinomonadaceae bacterium]